jgi:hypothetical protein
MITDAADAIINYKNNTIPAGLSPLLSGPSEQTSTVMYLNRNKSDVKENYVT